ncbi:hypothetical protein A1Q1_00402 [Trichosporon asahii var. asahii CBS 2479]|uniref:MULE transposase domain-containing protein n=1 Tax=Trichosporon asahii var. asahii (strain ATCC 90039 / CBS 2479 / JCM 2466 / KCTC 7840 / NBRC 103889/ NCYC 2677 / UAMH 7654) TaxID=1186058 RepID=J6F4Y8_TRIAS|nr:hypothetical protein A1Q1_00402 [Trichosporon asahii var. asahii CBS 2479]EJT50347.1 hypothetical protein A1Q1_00402 [Trichosporon asahii var. asahii CBS 2479]
MPEPQAVVRARLELPLYEGAAFAGKEKAHFAVEPLCNQASGTQACVRHETSKPLRLVSICITTYNKRKAAEKARLELRQLKALQQPNSAALKVAEDAVKNAKAECGTLCPFRVVMSRDSRSEPYRCTKLCSDHTCTVMAQPAYHGVSRRALMDQAVDALHTGAQTGQKSTAIADTLSKHLSYKPPLHTTQRARGRQRKATVAEHNRQWKQLDHYLELLRAADLNGLAEKDGLKVVVSLSSAPEVARRCKPVVAVDGCHSTGQHRLTISLACTLDGDNHLNVLSWGLAETECHAPYRRLTNSTCILPCVRLPVRRDELDLLHIPLLDDPDRVIVSDRQKGLLNAISSVLPGTKHSYCCQHLIQNVQKRFKRAAITRFFERLVHARTETEFMAVYNKGLTLYDAEVCEYINGIGPFSSWALPFFSFPGRFGTTTSNTVEATNSWIGELREKPVVDFLHGLPDKVLRHAVKQKKAAAAEKGAVSLRAMKEVSRELDEALNYLERAFVWATAPSIIGKVTSPYSRAERVGQTDLEPLVAPFCTTEGWRAVYETLMPLHALPAVSELGVDEDELLPKLRGSGSGRKKMKRWAEGKVASQASQVDRFQF